MFQHNFLAARTSNDNASALDVGGLVLLGLFLSSIIYTLSLVYMECRALCCCSCDFITRRRPGAVMVAIKKKPVVRRQDSLRLLDSHDPDVHEERERVSAIVATGNIDTVASAILVTGANKIYYGKGTVPTKVAIKEVQLFHPGPVTT